MLLNVRAWRQKTEDRMKGDWVINYHLKINKQLELNDSGKYLFIVI